MSARHQARRRRTYGRRQHELRERYARTAGRLGLEGDAEMARGWEDMPLEDNVTAWPGSVHGSHHVLPGETAA